MVPQESDKQIVDSKAGCLQSENITSSVIEQDKQQIGADPSNDVANVNNEQKIGAQEAPQSVRVVVLKSDHSNRLVSRIVEPPCMDPIMKGRWVSHSYYGTEQYVNDAQIPQSSDYAPGLSDWGRDLINRIRQQQAQPVVQQAPQVVLPNASLAQDSISNAANASVHSSQSFNFASLEASQANMSMASQSNMSLGSIQSSQKDNPPIDSNLVVGGNNSRHNVVASDVSGGSVVIESYQWSVDSVQLLAQRDHKPIEKVDFKKEGWMHAEALNGLILQAGPVRIKQNFSFSDKSD